ncbi:MAG: TlpA disulfide reductase family protein [Ferruginibacter sp.]
MKKIVTSLLLCITLFSCKDQTAKGKFVINGEIKNLPDQKIYLEQIYFSQKNPDILDTAAIKKGKFSFTATATEEGIYRLRMENADRGFIFINDKPVIDFKADMKDVSLEGPQFNTPANTLLKKFILNLDSKSRELKTISEYIDSAKAGDSTLSQATMKRDELNDQFKNFITRFIDTTSDPVVAIFALGYTNGIESTTLEKIIPGLTKRFPNHQAVASMVTQFKEYLIKVKEPKAEKTSKPGIGSMAPELTMNDVDGNPFSLSELKGKYVLVDFWASWCGPCRGENPNVVAAYNKYKDKNFTILGVSLDENKASWLKAIKADGLAWKQVSDLKQWNSAAVPLYGFDGIPYNVLIDPTGKIIATELRGEALLSKLEETLK